MTDNGLTENTIETRGTAPELIKVETPHGERFAAVRITDEHRSSVEFDGFLPENLTWITEADIYGEEIRALGNALLELAEWAEGENDD